MGKWGRNELAAGGVTLFSAPSAGWMLLLFCAMLDSVWALAARGRTSYRRGGLIKLYEVGNKWEARS